jgi:thiol-disulfide isomerase/thioredoxin
MSASLSVVLAVLVVALAATFVIGRLMTRRAGVLQSAERPDVDTSGLGLSADRPTVLHFSADWCGPCASVRRVVDEVCEALPGVAHVELDMDDHPAAARRLSVLSLPTTFIFDADGRQRYRASGVPKAADLRTALEPLLA